MSLRDEYVQKSEEMKEKFKEVIDDLSIKYDKDVGVGFDMLKAIARAKVYDVEPLYESNVEFDEDELVADYMELLNISDKIVNG